MSDESEKANLFSKALGTESGGEISCTVEETNRIRALLGLRPLDVGKPDKERQAVENFRQQREEEDKAREAKEIAARLEKAKEKRLFHAKLQGTGLGDAANEDAAEFVSAADWVKRSRKIEISSKEHILAKRLQEEEEDALLQQKTEQASYKSSDLQGLSVMHGADDFASGQEVILTLADSHVLETDQRGRAKAINENDDILENVNLADAGRKAEREKAVKKARKGYTGFDDDEFEPGAAPKTKPSILAQYDKDAPVGPKLILGQDGAVSLDTRMHVDGEGDNEAKPLPLSLQVNVKETDDYFSKAEYSSFKPKGEKRKKKKLRQKDTTVDEVDLEVSLLQSGATEGTGDVEAEGKSSNKGKSRAAPAPKVLVRIPVKNEVNSNEQSSVTGRATEEVVDDDAEIALSLARARRLALKRQHQEMEANKPGWGKEMPLDEDAGARWCKQRVEEIKSVSNESKNDDDEWNSITVDGRKSDGTFVFSETTEFSTRLQAQLNETARNRAEAAVKADERKQQQTEAKRRALAEANAQSNPNQNENADESAGTAVGMDVDDGLDDADEEEVEEALVEPVGRQPLVASSMAATLALLKDTGELRGGESLVGRAKDKRQQDPSARDFDVKLEYRDDTGRKLTQKEAFRQLNYQFHGIAPGKKKQEKRIKQLQLEDRSGSSRVVSGEGGTMRSLVRAQEATGSAFITVSGSSSSTTANSSGPTLTPAELAAQIHARRKEKEKEKEKEKHGKGKPGK